MLIGKAISKPFTNPFYLGRYIQSMQNYLIFCTHFSIKLAPVQGLKIWFCTYFCTVVSHLLLLLPLLNFCTFLKQEK